MAGSHTADSPSGAVDPSYVPFLRSLDRCGVVKSCVTTVDVQTDFGGGRLMDCV
jgi:hypothetical protein